MRSGPPGPCRSPVTAPAASIAFELARQLENSGADVTNLILFGAPYCKSYRRLQWAMAVVRHLSRRLMTHARALPAVPAAERGHYLAERVRGLLPREAEEVSDPVLIRRGAVVKATLAAVRAYSPKSVRPSTSTS